MTDSNVQQNLVPNDPSLKDLLDLLKKDVFLSLSCHHIGTVQSFDPIRQLCSATINYKKSYFQPDPVTGNYVAVLVDYPILLDCPAVVMGGGNGALTFPISKGDECLILFNDRDLDKWLQGSNTSAVATPRTHSFSDGLILVGVRSLANVLPGYSATETQLRSKDGANQISIGTDITVKLGTALTVTFKAAGGVSIVNSIGRFDFEDNADVSFDTGTVVGLFGSGGKVKFQNSTGELVTAIINAFATATAAGFPLLVDLTVLESFKVI